MEEYFSVVYTHLNIYSEPSTYIFLYVCVCNVRKSLMRLYAWVTEYRMFECFKDTELSSLGILRVAKWSRIVLLFSFYASTFPLKNNRNCKKILCTNSFYVAMDLKVCKCGNEEKTRRLPYYRKIVEKKDKKTTQQLIHI